MSSHRCPACGRQFDIAVDHCPQCGAIMSDLRETSDATAIKRKFWIFFVVLVAVCALAILVLPR